MKLVKNIKTTTFPVSRIKSMYDNDIIFIDNSFQRRYVWEEKHKVGWIETILLGFDIPAIYLWQQDPDVKTGEIRYSVVDGQQRIGAVISYINNDFPLSKKYLISNQPADWDNKYFEDLSDDYKKDIWAYAFNVNEISKDISAEEIKTMFSRLNITNKALNPQELRNAQFNGKFIRLAIELSELDFWAKYKVFSNNDIRRMKDVEFVSHLLIFLRKGMKIATSQATLNKMYDLYNEQYSETNKDKDIFISIIAIIETVIEMIGTSYKNKINRITHLYTLFVVVYALMTENYFNSEQSKILEKLCEFYKMYFENKYDNKYVSIYMFYSQDAVASVNSRMERYNSIINFIKESIVETN